MRKKRAHDHSIFELLSDISLSTLGLFLVFFVVYSLIFNSANITLIDKVDNLNRLTEELNNKNTQLKRDVKNANRRADKAENEKQLALERNKYTGYYKGTFETKFYYGTCYGDSYDIIQEDIALVYLQSSNTMIYSARSEKGTISYQIEGSLQGNNFTGRFSNYARSQNIEDCNKSPSEKNINFFEDYLEMYDSGDSSGKLILRKVG